MVACFCRLRTPDDKLSATVKVALSFRYGIQFSVRSVGHAGAKPGRPAAGRGECFPVRLGMDFQ